MVMMMMMMMMMMMISFRLLSFCDPLTSDH
jgi:ABC-type uncharacterized transport system permease subunit